MRTAGAAFLCTSPTTTCSTPVRRRGRRAGVESRGRLLVVEGEHREGGLDPPAAPRRWPVALGRRNEDGRRAVAPSGTSAPTARSSPRRRAASRSRRVDIVRRSMAAPRSTPPPPRHRRRARRRRAQRGAHRAQRGVSVVLGEVMWCASALSPVPRSSASTVAPRRSACPRSRARAPPRPRQARNRRERHQTARRPLGVVVELGVQRAQAQSPPPRAARCTLAPPASITSAAPEEIKTTHLIRWALVAMLWLMRPWGRARRRGC